MTFSRRRFCTFAAASAGLLSAAPRPKLLVWVIAEQFRPDYLDELWPSFGTGGFRRLVEGGSYFPSCEYNSTTFTCSGLATLLTGTWPSLHGIVADRWFDSVSGQPVEAGGKALRAGTLIEAAAAGDRNRVFVIASGSGAAFLEGCGATRNLRGTNESGARTASAWLTSNARPGAKPLRLIDTPALYEASPFALADQFSLMRETIVKERVGAGVGLDVAVLLLGAPGALGLGTGASSPLMRDMVVRLDQQIGALLDLLDSRVGKGNYAIAFTSAHGLDVKGTQRQGVDAKEIAAAIPNAHAYLYPFVYLNRANPEARRAVAYSLMKTGRIAGYYTADEDSSLTGAWRERFANSFYADRSGDLMVSYAAHAGESADTIAAGSIYNYDTRVPLILYGSMFRAQTIEDTVYATDIAPTLSRISGLELPASSTGRVLGEAIAPPKAAK
jgi:predicted AlkP superfamily pyrophosphatase or phosphodiesterase